MSRCYFLFFFSFCGKSTVSEHRCDRKTSPTSQAVVTLQLRILHRPLLLVRQRAGLADGRQEGGRGLGAGGRIPQHPAQPLDLQQSAVVLADRLSVFLILVALSALALKVQRPPHDVSWLIVGWLLQHRPTMMPLLQELELLLLIFAIFRPAAAVGGLNALMEPRGAANAAAAAAAVGGEAASAAIHPLFASSLDRTHLGPVPF